MGTSTIIILMLTYNFITILHKYLFMSCQEMIANVECKFLNIINL